MDKLKLQRLKKTLNYLESKQRELKKYHENDTRTLESIIKFLKKDMIEQYKLSEYDLYIKQEVIDTETFIKSVKGIIENNFQS